MKIKLYSTFRAIDGIGKGKEFIIININDSEVTYKSVETGRIYIEPRKLFEKYLQRVNKYWSEKNKSYKRNKQILKESEK